MNKALSLKSSYSTYIRLLGVMVFLGYAKITLGACSAGQLCNPLKSTSITEFLVAVIEVLLIFALPVVVFFIMYSGYLFVTASGDTSQIEKARTSLTWSIIGGVIVLGAQLIMNVVQNTVKAL
jgi:Type IV secretion system pilin